MKKHLISVQSGDWYDKSNDDKSMAYAKECGIEAIDYSIDHVINTTKFSEGEAYPICDLSLENFVNYHSSLKEASEKYGVAICQMHAPFPIYFPGKDDVNEYIINVLEKIIATCAYVNCPALVVHPFVNLSFDENMEINVAFYRRLIPAAKKYKVKICLENLFKSSKSVIFSNPRDAAKVIDQLNAEAGEDVFGFCFDLGHANLLRYDVRDFLNVLGKRLTVLHIHDNNGNGDSHLIPYTQTDNWASKFTTDWEGFIAGLRDINYEGNISFETFKGVKIMPKEVEKEALSLITAIGRYFRKRIEE